jgi:hypothetical protein
VHERPARLPLRLHLARDPDARREGRDAREEKLHVAEGARGEGVRCQLGQLEEADGSVTPGPRSRMSQYGCTGAFVVGLQFSSTPATDAISNRALLM